MLEQFVVNDLLSVLIALWMPILTALQAYLKMFFMVTIV